MPEQRIEPLNDAELRWVETELDNARLLVAQLNPNDAGAVLTPDVLDRTYKSARASAAQNADQANAIINAIGMAFGQHLVDRLGFEWVAVFDDAGSEIAVMALPGQADMLVFPPNLVAKRWESGATNFLAYVYKGIEEDLRKSQAAWQGNATSSQPSTDSRSGKRSSWLKRLFSRDEPRQ